MRGTHGQPPVGIPETSEASRSSQSKQPLNEETEPGLTLVPLDSRTAPTKSRPHPPLISNRRDELSGALRDEMRTLGEQFNSLEQNIHTLRAHSHGAERTKAAILANLSHEFRTPLNAIIGFSELLLSETCGPLGGERQREYVGDIRSSGLRLLHMIDRLLDNAECTSEIETFDRQTANPCKIISAVCESLEPVADVRGVIVGLQVQDSGVEFELDPARIHRAVKHVLMRAIRQSSIGDTVIVYLRSDGNALKLSVTDPVIRPGISPTSDISDEVDPCETDFGLSIAKKIFEHHDGGMEFSENANGGRTLHLTLPCRPGIGKD